LLAIARFKAISALRRRRDEALDEEAAAAIEDLSDNPATALEKKLTHASAANDIFIRSACLRGA
jgi:RNA polymerase sigma-70 factor (ECF subfamily)